MAQTSVVEKMFARSAAASTTCCLSGEVNCCRFLLKYWNKQTNKHKNNNKNSFCFHRPLHPSRSKLMKDSAGNAWTNKQTNIAAAVLPSAASQEKWTNKGFCWEYWNKKKQTNKQTELLLFPPPSGSQKKVNNCRIQQEILEQTKEFIDFGILGLCPSLRLGLSYNGLF